ncbi:hypothetical protein M4F77_004707 [Vibrio alginolyticus]|nr:hypothetical protein [Vibrio alginolyticus]
MKKTPIQENFLVSDRNFRKAQRFWEILISKAPFVDSVQDRAMFHTDGNPIYYNHFPQLGKSIRIIQEPYDSNLPPHLGAWVEQACDYRRFDELVISVELTNATYRPVRKLIYMWLNPRLQYEFSEAFLEEFIQTEIIDRDSDHGRDLEF